MMAERARHGHKRHVQQELFRRGGKRKNAGRKPKGTRAGSPHKQRPEVKPSHPLHIVLHVASAVGSLRRRKLYHAIREATVVAAVRERIRIVQISIQRTHIHLIVEAENKRQLARGLQGFQISAARNINTALGDGIRRRRGPVFPDRYHLEVVASPRHARHVLGYVLGNWRKHGEDKAGLAKAWLVDPFSSAISFPGWKELEDKPWMWTIRNGYDPLMVRRPRSWLLCEGWKRHGSISGRDRPGPG